jgi:hypothetical protein
VKPAETAIAGQWLNTNHVVTPTDTNVIIEYGPGAMFYMLSVPRCYKQDDAVEDISGTQEEGERTLLEATKKQNSEGCD